LGTITSIWVALEQALIERCLLFGAQMIHGYAVGRMTDRKVYGEADRCERLQAMAKMAECAFAIFARRSPEDLDWFGDHKNGDGHDLVVDRYFFDVKHTEEGRKLIWPLTKNDEFWTKDFNCLALVVGSPPSFEIVGIVSKNRFFQQKEVAQRGDGSGLAAGTWFMRRQRLSDPLLIHLNPPFRRR
jgi:hypothetical protein